MKINDNELLCVWNECLHKVDNSNNIFLENKYLKLTHFTDISKSKIINTRRINDNKYISFVFKFIDNITIYSFIIFNL